MRASHPSAARRPSHHMVAALAVLLLETLASSLVVTPRHNAVKLMATATAPSFTPCSDEIVSSEVRLQREWFEKWGLVAPGKPVKAPAKAPAKAKTKAKKGKGKPAPKKAGGFGAAAVDKALVCKSPPPGMVGCRGHR